MEDKYIYCVYEDCHGCVSMWDDEDRAKVEVDRIFKEIYAADKEMVCESFHNGWGYGCEMIYYIKTKINVPW